MEKAQTQSLDLAEGKQDPEPTWLRKGMQRKGGVHEEGPAEPALVRVRQITRKNTGPGLQPYLSVSLTLQLCSCSHLPSILRALPGDKLHTLPSREKGMCCGESLCKHARSRRLGSFWGSPVGQGQVLWLQGSGLHLTPFSNPRGQGLPSGCLLHRAWRSKTNLRSASHRPGPAGLRPQQSESQPGP